MALDPRALPTDAVTFLQERHLGALATTRADGSPHLVPVGFTFDAPSGVVRIITFASAQKARNAALGGRAAVMQVDGARWLSLEGPVRLNADPDAVADAVAAYAVRYRQPSVRSDRVAIEITVDRVLGQPVRRG